MSQTVSFLLRGEIEKLSLPSPNREVLPGVRWGNHYALFTPAFWATQAWLAGFEESSSTFRIGKTLEEELAACLLGGHGISAEIGLAAFYRVRDCGLLVSHKPPSELAVYEALSIPLTLGDRQVRYRFASQRSKYLSAALSALHREAPPIEDDLAFREWLLGLAGVGPKTASWITRNWLKSDRVAIIDIHIYRAGVLMGLYQPTESPATNYFEMEGRFLALAQGMNVKASFLDALIWRNMKHAGSIVLKLVNSIRKS